MPRDSPLRIVIPGGTGYLGSMLARHLHEQGHAVSAITRFPKPQAWQAVHWDAENLGDWAASLDGCDLVINLAGSSLRCHFTAANKAVILRSRVRTTQLIGEAITQCSRPPRLWINVSTVDIYPDSRDCDLDETSELAGDFLGEMALAWERAAYSLATPQTRRVLMRLAPVMSPIGGSFKRLLRLVRNGFGGQIGNGEQYVSWIHDFDFVRAIEFLMQRVDLEGAVNMTAPHPIPNHQFMCNLRSAWSRSYFGLPLPTWLVEAVSLAIGREPQSVLKSRRVIPGCLLDAGFAFQFPEWRGACENLVDRWRVIRAASA